MSLLLDPVRLLGLSIHPVFFLIGDHTLRNLVGHARRIYRKYNRDFWVSGHTFEAKDIAEVDVLEFYIFHTMAPVLVVRG